MTPKKAWVWLKSRIKLGFDNKNPITLGSSEKT
jgi:hypothetical protein